MRSDYEQLSFAALTMVPNATSRTFHQKKGREIIFDCILFVIISAIRTHQIKLFSSLHYTMQYN